VLGAVEGIFFYFLLLQSQLNLLDINPYLQEVFFSDLIVCDFSVEKMFYVLKKCGHPTFDPMEVTKEGYLSVRSDALACPQTMCALLHDYKYELTYLKS